ncbi:hypothetical protein B9T62_08680 [Paenibacillus donghaensis]|uniref:Transposase putative helix-turn-helix domain-containing protein n=1 Tax=Paenibacillus donghaensis TaxID=414771 RepID=A0A2Z2KFG4_9BACL|nr:hypothetical protein B9T62_08680 [Paenibacillus donghaensis]
MLVLQAYKYRIYPNPEQQQPHNEQSERYDSH